MKIIIQEQRESFNKVYVTDFGDDYHKTIVASTELEAAARKIRRRYKRIDEYLEALTIYNEYMEHVYSLFPSRKLAKMNIQRGLVNMYLPAKPRMKNNLAYKMYQKGIIISDEKAHVNSDELEKVLDDIRENTKHAEVVIKEELADTKETRKLMRGIGASFTAKKKGPGKVTDYDLLTKFFMQNQSDNTEKEGYREEIVPMSDIISDRYYDYVDETEDEDEIINYRGRYLTRAKANELSVFEGLGVHGWDNIKLMRARGASKTVTKLAEREAKAERKRRKRRKKNDDYILGVAGTNGGDFESFKEYEDEMLNMSIDSYFNNINRGD